MRSHMRVELSPRYKFLGGNLTNEFREEDVAVKRTERMKSDYWNVSDEQVVEKTGKDLKHWMKVLKQFDASKKKSNDVVAYLQNDHEVPRYWGRTLTTRYLKLEGGKS